MNTKNIRLVYKIYKKFPRYTIYSIYKIVLDDQGKMISKEFIYNTTSPPKEATKDE